MKTNLINNFNNALVALNLKQPKQEKSYAGRLFSVYTGIVQNAKPTRYNAVNFALRGAFAIAAIVPTIIATIGALVADGAVLAKKGAFKGFDALKNKFAKKQPSKLERAVEFAKNNKKAILGGAAAIALATGGYVYRDAIAQVSSNLYNRFFSAAEMPEFFPGNAEGAKEAGFYNFLNSFESYFNLKA